MGDCEHARAYNTDGGERGSVGHHAVAVVFLLTLPHAAAVAPDRHDAAPTNTTRSLPPQSSTTAPILEHHRAPASPQTVARRLLHTSAFQDKRVTAVPEDQIRAAIFQDESNHATCAVYPYRSNTGAVDRARPVPGLQPKMCQLPLCLSFAGDDATNQRTLSVANAERHGRWNDTLRVFCAVHSLERASSPSVFFPWRSTWRAHLPVTDPDAAAASGIAHMDYTEGYYIRCPAGDGSARLSCTEFPEEAVASAVWEHRKRTYSDTIRPLCDSYVFGTDGPLLRRYHSDL